MENGNALNDLRSDTGYNNGGNKMSLLYKVPPYSHPTKRPLQSVGDVSSQNTVTVSLMNEREEQMPGQAVVQPSTVLQHAPAPQMQHNVYSNKGLPQKMVALQIQRDPKTGSLMMMNSNSVRSQPVIQIGNQGAQPSHASNHVTNHGTDTGNVASHGYHPGRHLHHQLQLKHLPQGATAQLSHNSSPQQQPPSPQQPSQQPSQQPPQQPSPQQLSPQQPSPQQPSPQQHIQQQTQTQQQQQPQQVLQIRQPVSYQAGNRPYENMTYTRTYPQVSQQNCQFNAYSNTSTSVHRPRFITPLSQTFPQMLVRSAGAQQQVMTSQQHTVMTSPQHTVRNLAFSGFQNHPHRTETEQRLSHFDYGEQDDNAGQFSRSPAFHPQNADKSSNVRVSGYNHVFVTPQPRAAQVIGQLRPSTQTLVSQPGALSSSQPLFRRTAAQPLVIRNQMRQDLVGQQSPVLTSRPPNVVASPANNSLPNSAPLRPVILTAQQAGQTGHPLQSTPVVVQINGGKSIRGSILSVSPQQTVRPVTTASPSNSTHVYFTIPQGNGAAKFVRTPNGHLRPVNGVALQNSLSQSKMYTVRYVTPKTDESKSKQQYTIYSTIAASNNTVKILSSNAGSKSEKILIPKSRPSSPEFARKRKLTPTKTSNQPAKVTKIEPAPCPLSSPHNELLIRVNKSLDGDREAVLKPDCNTPFESFPDTFRKLMKYHIFYEPDTKESCLKRADRQHEEISQKLLYRKENLFNKYHGRFLEDATKPLPRFVEQCSVVTLLQQQVFDEKERLQEIKDEIEKVKQEKVEQEKVEQEKAREEKEEDDTSSSENDSADPEGPID